MMREEEKWEELKREIKREIEHRKAIPEEIEDEVNSYFDQIIEIYKNNHCDYETIEKYSEGSKKHFQGRLRTIEKERKSEQLRNTNQAISGIQRNTQENEGQLKQKQQFFNMETKESAQVTKIWDNINDEIKNIRARQRSILSARGYSDDRITQIDQKVAETQYLFRQKKETYFLALLEKDSETLTNQIIKAYEETIEQITTNEKDKSKQNFKEQIASNISLEEQKAYTENILKRGNEQEIKRDPAKTLPSNVLE